MNSRLSSIAPDLAAKVASLPLSRRTAVAVAACKAASGLVSCTPLQTQVLAELQAGATVEPRLVQQLFAETESLDEAYFAAAELDESSGVLEFFMARIGAALQFALDSSEDAASEAIYEASMASDDQGIVLDAARAELEPRAGSSR